MERKQENKECAYIGVDLGGTNMRAGRITGDQLVSLSEIPTPKGAKNQEETLEALIGVIRSVWDASVAAIGIGVPSVVDRERFKPIEWEDLDNSDMKQEIDQYAKIK